MGLGIIDRDGDGKQDWVDEMIEMDMILDDAEDIGRSRGPSGGSSCCTTTLLCLPFYLLKTILLK